MRKLELLGSKNEAEQTTALLEGIKAGSLSAKAFAFAAQVRRSCCPVLGLLPRVAPLMMCFPTEPDL